MQNSAPHLTFSDNSAYLFLRLLLCSLKCTFVLGSFFIVWCILRVVCQDYVYCNNQGSTLLELGKPLRDGPWPPVFCRKLRTKYIFLQTNVLWNTSWCKKFQFRLTNVDIVFVCKYFDGRCKFCIIVVEYSNYVRVIKEITKVWIQWK